MSKAFTKEDAGGDEIVGRPITRGETRPITARGLTALQRRLATLEAELAALPAGDARRALAHEREQVAAALADVRVVEAPARPASVAFGCRVRVRGERGERVLVLVGPDEAEPREGRISVRSPVGQALLGAAPGDEVELRRPGGVELVEVLAIDAEP